MLPTCCSCISRTASRRGVSALHTTGWRMANSPNGVFSEYWVPRVSTARWRTCWLTWSSRLLTPRRAKSRNTSDIENTRMNAALFSCRQKVSSPARCSVRVARSPSRAASGKHSPLVISNVVSTPGLARCWRSPTTRPCLTM
ncbi:hypothetical protein D3C77_540090 [compost metagenome]